MIAWLMITWLMTSSHVTRVVASCPCDFCGNTTYCSRMSHTMVPIGIPKQGLNRLLLDHNNITDLRGGSFRQMASLKELVLNDNKIETIETNSFDQLSNLLYLYLDNNRISSLAPGTLAPLVRLKRLFLDSNSLARVPDDVSGLEQLERLGLEGNRIVTIDWTRLVRLDQLQLVKLWSGNALACSCDVIQLVTWLARPKLPRIAAGKFPGRCEKGDLPCADPRISSIRHYGALDNRTRAIYESGDRLHIHCETEGRPRPLVVWIHPTEGAVLPYKSGRVESWRNGTLSIDPVSHNDSGSYACFIVMGDMKQAGSRKVTVRVSKDTPRVVVTPSEDRVYVAAGKSASLACVVTSARPVTLEWFTPRDSMVTSSSSSDGGKYRTLNGGGTLEVRNVSSEDAGSYKCVASNAQGTAEGEVVLELAVLDHVMVAACACAGALLVVAVVTGACLIQARRRRRRIKMAAAPTSGGGGGGEEPEAPREHDWIASGDDVTAPDVIQQPYTIEPEVKGFRL